MKKLPVLFILVCTICITLYSFLPGTNYSPSPSGSAYEVSVDFSKKLAAYKQAVPKETSYLVYSTERLTKCLATVNAANDVIDAIKTPADYVNFLAEVNFESCLPRETMWPALANADTGSQTYKMQYEYQPEVRKNYYLIKELTMAYMKYQPKFAKNSFTKQAIIYANSQIKKAEIMVSADGDLWSGVSIKKSLSSYSDYELYIINYFCFDTFDAITNFEKDDVQKVSARLKSSKYLVYQKLGDDLLMLLDQ